MRFNFSEPVSVLLSTALLPPLVLRAAVDSGWRNSLPHRFGFGSWQEVVAGSSGKRFWFHGASVGEVGGMSPAVLGLREKFPELEILLSTTSETGREEIRRQKLSLSPHLLPFDHPLIVAPLLEKIKPAVLVLSETELWPNLLFSLKRKNIPAVLINGRISDYTVGRYMRFRSFFEPALEALEHLFVQSEQDGERFCNLGVSKAKIEVIGSTKYDKERPNYSETELRELRESMGLLEDAPCFVAGSVRPGEESAVIGAYIKARKSVPNLQMVIAPRHPERFEPVAEALRSHGMTYNRRSLGEAKQFTPILLLDTLGELQKAYALSTLCFIGGTLVNLGGHNPFEPAAFAKPIVLGPYTQNSRDAIAALKREDGVLEVRDASELTTEIVKVCQDVKYRLQCGQGAHRAWQANTGATKRVIAYLERYV